MLLFITLHLICFLSNIHFESIKENTTFFIYHTQMGSSVLQLERKKKEMTNKFE